MESGLKGRKCLITGGHRGIGFGIAKALALEGVHLAVAGREFEPAAMEELNLSGGKAIFLKTDLSEESQTVELVRQSISELDGLDLFVNNAAVAQHEPVTKVTTDAFYKTINTNLAACVWACREVSRHMISRNSGSILIVNSTARVCPGFRETSYRISKMGLKMYMEILAIELAPFGIRVNQITPGHYPTRLTSATPSRIEALLKSQIPLRRFGNPDEVGPAAVLLLSDRLSGYITGADITIDGGLSLRPLPLYSDEEIIRMNSTVSGSLERT
jgi:NAD(P)-dependent dehydrogenase (short-subunit alcohol dehydrogenase family)